MAEYQATHTPDSGYANTATPAASTFAPAQYGGFNSGNAMFGGSAGNSTWLSEYGAYGANQQLVGDLGGYPNGQEHPFPYPFPQPDSVVTPSHYEPSLLAQCLNRIQVLETQLVATKRDADEAKATARQLLALQEKENGEVRKKNLQTDAMRTKTQGLVQDKARWLLSVRVMDAEGQLIEDLPHPLKEDEEPGFLADGVTRKAHPNWNAGVSDKINVAFCTRVTNLAMDAIGHDDPAKPAYGNPSREDVMAMAKQYYRTLRRVYSAQTTPEGEERHSHKLTLGKWRGRKVQKAANLRRAVDRFREIHGKENTVGDYDAIQTDDMSSEHSDCGNVPQDVFKAHRKRSGGGEQGWEVRPKNWHSRFLKLYYAHLKTISRQLCQEKSKKRRGSSKVKTRRVPRFKSLPANNNNSAPVLVRDKPLYEKMVSSEWMEQVGMTYKELNAVANPAELTLFNLALTTEGLDDIELEYLADDETA
ncbi:hypothetical protein MSAN_01786100 [Mycena sanguinolenta]|uniref:Uncharacterized protein n=1 Tax=Mycena sanguinolenta TaxID=230812 RepID=A0A8H6XVI1_9AGAR|nr:hypothetical protein MSAN_01786100 [Mycena sanguinolenta]